METPLRPGPVPQLLPQSCRQQLSPQTLAQSPFDDGVSRQRPVTANRKGPLPGGWKERLGCGGPWLGTEPPPPPGSCALPLTWHLPGCFCSGGVTGRFSWTLMSKGEVLTHLLPTRLGPGARGPGPGAARPGMLCSCRPDIFCSWCFCRRFCFALGATPMQPVLTCRAQIQAPASPGCVAQG